METTFEITKSFGPDDMIARLTEEAIGIAKATGSVGATCDESTWNSREGERLIASVTVARTNL